MDEPRLKEWIAEHRVCFEVSPHFEVHHHDTVHVGFELALFARAPSSALAHPSGPEMRQLLENLRDLLTRALPPGAEYAVRSLDGSLHLRTSSWEPEVQVVAETLHGSTFAVADERERSDVKQARQALLRLGVQEGVWSALAVRQEHVLVH